jgi:hypothetical protein
MRDKLLIDGLLDAFREWQVADAAEREMDSAPGASDPESVNARYGAWQRQREAAKHLDAEFRRAVLAVKPNG